MVAAAGAYCLFAGTVGCMAELKMAIGGFTVGVPKGVPRVVAEVFLDRDR
jgi:hypothetical protein